MDNLSNIVNDYIKRHRKGAEKELRWFSIQPSLIEAVSLAALAQSPSGKRLNHQHRIPRTVLENSKCMLLKEIDSLESSKSFEELFEKVESIIGGINGIGELTVYDTAG